jgi:hypothetical protein
VHFQERGEHVGLSILTLHTELGFDFVPVFFSRHKALQADSSGIRQTLGEEITGDNFVLVPLSDGFGLIVGDVNTTAPALASETAYITAFAHFLLSRPTPLSLRSVEPRRPCRALALSHTLCTHLVLYSTLTLRTAAPSVHVLPHFLDISTFLRLSLVHQTAFPRIGPLSRASPGVPLAPPVHIVPSLPCLPALTLVPGLLSYTFSI